jgi:hypothetical protein
MSRILPGGLASGVGAGDLRWIEEPRATIWEIVRKASSVEKTDRAMGLSDLVIFLPQVGVGVTNLLFLVPIAKLPKTSPNHD